MGVFPSTPSLLHKPEEQIYQREPPSVVLRQTSNSYRSDEAPHSSFNNPEQIMRWGLTLLSPPLNHHLPHWIPEPPPPDKYKNVEPVS
jgi:hypothetical protein